MKNITLTTIAALLLGSTGLFAVEATPTAAYTKPSGFVTHTLKAGQFNLIGLTLHEPVTLSGDFSDVIEGAETVTLADSDVDFDAVLTSGAMYILEIVEAQNTALNGVVQEFNSWTKNEITAPLISGLQAGDKYQIRQAATLQQIFGDPSVLKGSASATSADVVWLPDGDEGFVRYFYKKPLFGDAGWHNATDDTSVDSDIPLIYSEGVLVQMSSSSEEVDLVVTGSVKTGKVSIGVYTGFSLVGNVYPVGSTLQGCGIATQLVSTATATSSDVIWLPDSSGGYVRYFYKTPLFGGDPAWYNATSGAQVVSDVVLPSAFFIHRQGSDVNMDFDPPSGYENL